MAVGEGGVGVAGGVVAVGATVDVAVSVGTGEGKGVAGMAVLVGTDVAGWIVTVTVVTGSVGVGVAVAVQAANKQSVNELRKVHFGVIAPYYTRRFGHCDKLAP